MVVNLKRAISLICYAGAVYVILLPFLAVPLVRAMSRVSDPGAVICLSRPARDLGRAVKKEISQ